MDTENLTHESAVEKMKEMAQHIKVAMLLTNLGNEPASATPMTTKRVDEDGSLWFLSPVNSEHNKNIQTHTKIQLLYSHPVDMQFLSVYGDASVETHQSLLEELYSEEDNAWFTGTQDPGLTAIKVMPERAFYWDNKQRKYINLLEHGVAVLLGKSTTVEKKGKLKL